MRLPLLAMAFLLSCPAAKAAETVDYYAKIKANYAKLTPFSAKVTVSILAPAEPAPAVNTTRLIACDTDKFRCLFLNGDRAPQEWFRSGKVWYRCDPQIPSHYKGFADSMPGAFPLDPRELGSSELSISLASALADPAPELVRRDENEIVLRLASPTKEVKTAWLVHFSTTHGLPLKSQFLTEDKLYLEIALAYREVAEGVYFPRAAQHTFYDPATGSWTQKLIHSYELTSSQDRALGEKLLPPSVPADAITADYTVKDE